MGHYCSGMEESKVSSSSRKSPSYPGGRYTTTKENLTGAVTKMTWYSKVLHLAMGCSTLEIAEILGHDHRTIKANSQQGHKKHFEKKRRK